MPKPLRQIIFNISLVSLAHTNTSSCVMFTYELILLTIYLCDCSYSSMSLSQLQRPMHTKLSRGFRRLPSVTLLPVLATWLITASLQAG